MAGERFEHHARLMSVLTFVSRITGLVRDGALAAVFGVGPINDAFAFGFQIPNLFRRLFGEGALSAAFLPRYSELVRDDPEVARRYLGLVLALLAGLLWIIVLAGEIGLFLAWLGAPEVSYTFGPAVRHGGVPIPMVGVSYARLSYELTMIMLPYMPLVCIVAIGGAALQVHGRFGPMAAAPIVLNLAFIAAILGFGPWALGGVLPGGALSAEAHVRVVAASVLVSGAIQVAWTLRVLRIAHPSWALRDATAWVSVRATVLAAFPMMLGLGVLQINTAIDGLIASWPTYVGPTIFGYPYPLEEGAMSSLTYAQRLYEFPLGVFGISIATAVFPLLAKQNNDMAAFAATLRRALRLTVFIGLPASVGLILTARESVGTLFQRGNFTPEDTRRVAWVLIGFAPAIWSYQMGHIFTRAFYARKEAMTPVFVALGMVVLNIALNVTLIFTPLREAGLAWSTAICSMLQSVILLRILTRRVPGSMDREVVGGWFRCVLATAAMAVAVVAATPLAPVGETWSDLATALAVKIAVAVVVYGIACRLLGMPELGWLLRRGRSSS
ncbi:MAG: murein biosynthesis integral membrane protein MurJ [Planctomycetaceae bacterium]|nr:murein biosynthesis integral membrane protein MurJ [Planctomycetaceae bacterium]